MMFMKSFIALAVAISGVRAAFDINSKNNLVMYWGQSSAGSEQSLGDYCAQTAGDIYVLSFLYEFGSGTPSLNIDSCSETFPGSTLLHCPNIGADIKSCQQAGKKVLLSLGGAVGQYGFSSDSEAQTFAGTLWDLFGGGSSDTRPFDDAVVDGFDLDIENDSSTGYVALVNQLRQYFSGASKDYYISTAPQCPYPDANVGDVLANADIDFAFIQFYNNYCSIGPNFNFDTWQNFASNTSPNKNIKLFLGLPGSTSAAGSGYEQPDAVASAVASISTDSNFAGIMLWDASQGFTNQVNGVSYAQAMQNILDGQSGGNSGASVSSPVLQTSTSSVSIPTSSVAAPLSSSQPVVTASPSTFSIAVNSGLDSDPTGLTLVAIPESTTTTVATTTESITSVVGHVTFTKQVQPIKSVNPAPPSTEVAAAAPSATGSASAGGPCTGNETTCIDGKYSVCNFNQWVTFDCPAGTVCLVSGGASCGFPPSKRDETFVVRRHKHHAH
ncbi:Cts1p [Sugiyamaella lignohabitans]|uniref:chitinase n=1 Tax=Sugiyamaella lignohabitans TaxID=796027 RepID=A0A167F8K8_9ASCO|nr:Cts1p [Sugiyamaella lignohabitans]ANB14961.1 Cts1p [Sugiyamaella lignohabitans]